MGKLLDRRIREEREAARLWHEAYRANHAREVEPLSPEECSVSGCNDLGVIGPSGQCHYHERQTAGLYADPASYRPSNKAAYGTRKDSKTTNCYLA